MKIYSAPIAGIALLLTACTFDRPFGMEAENVPTVWKDFVAATQSGAEPVLPDFSYAGYGLGETAIPETQGKRFDVTKFDAVADDEGCDRAAIEAAIAAAEKNGGGIVFFPPGQFRVNEEKGGKSGIEIHGEHIVLQGSGSGPGGTEIFMREYLDPVNPQQLWSVPKMFAFRPADPSQINTKVTVIAEDARRETFSMVVEDASALKPGMLLELSMNNPAANSEFLDGLEPWDIWTTTIEKGVNVRGERHRIKQVDGNGITFEEPIHCNIRAAHEWTVSISTPLKGWRVENIHFRGNWKEKFVHHKDAIHDAGWSFLSFFYGESPILRNCRFSDCSDAATMSACYAGSIINCSIEGNRGHNSFASAYYSSGTLIAFCADIVEGGAFHGLAASSGAVGTVITRCKNSDRGFDWHGSWPYCTLLDACSGGLIGNGGNHKVLPNHMRHLVFWNFKQTAGETYERYDWWEARKGKEQYSGAKIVNPIIVGYHGLPTPFKPESCGLIESHGTPVGIESLYEAQLVQRLGKLPAWVADARAAFGFFMENGYWPQAGE